LLAATYEAGVVWLEDSSRSESAWTVPGVDIGLPLRDVERIYLPVNSVMTRAGSGMVLAGGSAGIYRSQDGGKRYENASTNEFVEKVTIPDTWVFCSGPHEIEVQVRQ
jgi:hypothetical protein